MVVVLAFHVYLKCCPDDETSRREAFSLLTVHISSLLDVNSYRLADALKQDIAL